MDTVDFTEYLTAAVCKLIREYAGVPKTEYKLPLAKAHASGRVRHGQLDVFSVFADQSKLAVEIDRGNKLWSLEKLAFAVESLGAEAVWIRWRGVIKFHSLQPVRFVDLTSLGNHLPARGARNRAARDHVA